jgi:predicted nucleic acid-binding protein
VIILDTNVVSEGTKPSPSEAVMNWLAGQIPSEVFVTTITVAEVLYGVEAVPHGKRRNWLLAAADRMFAQDFAGRILPFDEDAARAYATIVASRNASGRPISQFDAMIAAIARTNRATVATRNIADFEHCGVQLVDPWKHRGRYPA